MRERDRRWIVSLFVCLSAACDDDTMNMTSDTSERRSVFDAGGAGWVDATGQACRLNSDCIPQLYCSDAGRCTFECREDRDCLSERCVSGQCRPPIMMNDSDMGGAGLDMGACSSTSPCPEGTICETATGRCRPPTTEGCTDNTCPLGQYCDVDNERCQALPANCLEAGCPTGFGCHRRRNSCIRLPTDCRLTDCPQGFACGDEASQCLAAPDCAFDGCDGAAVCNEETGDCVEMIANSPLGGPCERSANCVSGLCLDVSVEGHQHTLCASPCCSEFDCPVGFGCRDTMGIQICLPSEIYPVGYSFDAVRGQQCGPGARSCQSGLCNLQTDRCLGICCTDGDCGGGVCQFRQVGNLARAICETVPLGFGQTGQGCRSEFDCMSGVCVPVPVNGFPGQCADLCCRSDQCPQTTTCGQVVGLGGTIVSACVPLIPGPQNAGSACMNDGVCGSGQCVERVCREPCCRDDDCAHGERCLPRPNDEGSLVRVCVPQGA
ncbi:MAG: hypothetical protein ACON3Z_07105 [Bradymonadia bacterium]